jgi:cardiolipin synthase
MLENVARQGIESALNRRAVRTAVRVGSQEAAGKIAGDTLISRAATAARTAAKELPSRAELAVMKNATLRNQITLHVSPEASHEALLESIRTAKSSFLIETFIWHNDKAGNEVIQALADRIKLAKNSGESFDAKVLIDWFGLRQGTGGKSDPEIVNKLRDAGVDVLEFARGYVDEMKLIPLTHRKLYIKDGSQFITGGRNLGDEYLLKTFTDPNGGHQLSWHDLMFTVEGEETGRIIDQFFDNWKRAGGKVPDVKPTIVPHPTGLTRVESFITNPHAGIYTLQKAHLELVRNAEKEIVVMYPYLSDDRLIAAMIEAKRKNPALSIRIILPASKEVTAEGGIYELLNKESSRQLMRVGAEVRMNQGGVVDGKAVERFSHFKGLSVDRKVISIGSANGDARTFRNNHELNTVIAGKDAVEDFHRQVIGPDWANAKPLTQADLDKDTLWIRIKQRVLEALDFLL